MGNVLRKITLISVSLIGLAGLAGCATTLDSVESAQELADARDTAADSVVFGKFRLVRNGREARLGEGLFANTATLHFYRGDEQQEIVGKVGRDGEFAWMLEPGDYRLVTIGFDNRGERAETSADFEFSVEAGQEAVYIGTLTLEASFDSGYYGLNGTVDDYIVRNDCDTDCASRLAQLGMSNVSAAVALAEPVNHLAKTY